MWRPHQLPRTISAGTARCVSERVPAGMCPAAMKWIRGIYSASSYLYTQAFKIDPNLQAGAGSRRSDATHKAPLQRLRFPFSILAGNSAAALEPGRCSAAWRCRRTPRRGRERASTARVVAGRHRIASTSRNEFPPRREEPESPGRDMRCRRRVAGGQARPQRASVSGSASARQPGQGWGWDGAGGQAAQQPASGHGIRPARPASWGGARARVSTGDAKFGGIRSYCGRYCSKEGDG